MNTRVYFFIEILTVLLHEVVLSKCDSEIKNYNNYPIKSYVNEFHRTGRQTPPNPPIVHLDATHVYVPQRTEQVAPNGYGIQTAQQSSKNKVGHGEVGPERDASAGHTVYDSSSGSGNGSPAASFPGHAANSDAPTVHFVQYGSLPEGNDPGRRTVANNGYGNIQIEKLSVTTNSADEKLQNGIADYGRVVVNIPQSNAQPNIQGQGPIAVPNTHNENTPVKINNYNENGLSPAAGVTSFQNPGGSNQQSASQSHEQIVVVKTNSETHQSHSKDIQNNLPPLSEPASVLVPSNNNNYTIVRFGASQSSFSSYTSQVWHSTQTTQTHGTSYVPLAPAAQGGSTSSLVGADQGYQLIHPTANIFGQSRPPQQPSDTKVDRNTTTQSLIKESSNYQNQNVASGNDRHDQGGSALLHGYSQNIAPVVPPKSGQNGYVQNNVSAKPAQTSHTQNIISTKQTQTGNNGYVLQNNAPATPPKSSQDDYTQNNAPTTSSQTGHNGYAHNIAHATPPKDGHNSYDPTKDKALLQTINQIVGQINHNSAPNNGAQAVQNQTPWVITDARPHDAVPNYASSATIQSSMVYNNNKNNNYVPGDPNLEKNVHVQQVLGPCTAPYGNVMSSTIDVDHGFQIDKTHSTFVPQEQSQIVNTHSESAFDTPEDDYGVYGKPGPNAFSNFAPGNEPYRPPPLPARRSSNSNSNSKQQQQQQSL